MPVLGKRARNTSPSPTATPRAMLSRRRVNIDLGQRDLLTPEPTPNPKRPRPSSTAMVALNDDSNKENIPPKPVDALESRSRIQQHIVTQLHPSPPSTPRVHRNRSYLRPQNQESATSLVGRDKERNAILSFLDPFLSDTADERSTVGLYISGAPGTGKTALMNDIVSSISASPVDSVRTIFINCMTLETRDLQGVWDRCAGELHVAKNRQRTSSLKNDWSKHLAKIFDGIKCLLILDEIDNLVTPACPLSNVFDIATSSPQLRIIGISNMHVLSSAKSINGVQTLHFEPYTAAQMKFVLTSRLATMSTNSDTFTIPTIALLCMKVASQTGDIRMLFSVARRALDLAIHESAPNASIVVNPAHVLAALKVCNASNQSNSGTETVNRVRSLGLQARFALISLLISTRRLNSGLLLTSANTGSTTSPTVKVKKDKNAAAAATSSLRAVEVIALHGFYMTLLSKGSFSAMGRVEFVDLMNLLEGNGLVQLSLAKKGKSKGAQTASIASGVREEELIRGLIGGEGEGLDVKEEEISHMWHREIARMEREMKYEAAPHSTEPDFENAQKD